MTMDVEDIVINELEDVAAVGEPEIGMIFESKEAAYYFYREYARSLGFRITIKASRRSKRTGKFIDVKISCSRYGSKRRGGSINARSSSFTKTDCKAGLHIKRLENEDDEERWIVFDFVKEHNHDFSVVVRGKNKSFVEVADRKKGFLRLGIEGFKLLLEYFAEMQDKQPGFFYAVDFDRVQKRVRNVFWIDAKAKRDYCGFSDVVLFDTFYVGNGYRIPFVPFVGVNNHCRYVMLGCCLIGEESESTYNWLFRTWLKAVGGKAPGVIVTDQDKSLSDVVVEVFPSSRHCFCLWNVLSKIPEMLNRDESFGNCVYSSWTDEEFERKWLDMISEFELTENEWFKSLFRDREKWVPHYFRGICLAGLSGPERSGSIASHFDKYMNAEDTFKEFFEGYTKFLEHRCDAEGKDSKQRSTSAFEKQLSLIYTDAAFKKFQAEVPGVVSCRLRNEREDDTLEIFRVEDFERRRSFFVDLKKDLLDDVCCSCYLFEYQGFLCKHAILVLQNSDVSTIPSRYILNRWSKSGNNREDGNEERDSVHNRMTRFDDLCRRFVKLGEVASVSDESYKTALKLLEETMKRCVSMNNSPKFSSEPDKLPTSESIGFENDGAASKFSKKKKIQKKRKEQVSSKALSFENCYDPRADMEETELGSRATTLGVYESISSQQAKCNRSYDNS